MFQELMGINFSNVQEVDSVLTATIDSIKNTCTYDLTNLNFDVLIFVEVLKKTRHDLEKMSKDMDDRTPDLYKQYGVFAYWIKRLKPFNERSTKYKNYTNEIIGLTFAISKVNQRIHTSKKITNVPEYFLKNLMYLIRFEQISKYGMVAILSAMFETK